MTNPPPGPIPIRRRLAGLAATLIVALLLWGIAYTRPVTQQIDVGGNATTTLREHDAPFLRGFHASEPATDDWAARGAYRWSEPDAGLRFPGAGGGAWIMTISAASGRADGSAAPSIWQIGDAPAVTMQIAATPRVYHVLGTTRAGDLNLNLRTPRYDAPGDPRPLGIVVSRATIRTTMAKTPPWPTLIALLAPTLTAWGALAACTAARRWWRDPALLAALGVVAICGWMLGWRRFDLTLATEAWTLLAIACAALFLPLRALTHTLARRCNVPLTLHEPARVTSIVLAAFAVRMGGVLHPFALFSDLGLHINNLLLLTNGLVLRTTGLPCEAGAGLQPYPPGLSLMAAPLQLLLDNDRLVLGRALQSTVALAESLGALLVWLLLRRAGAGRRAAILGAALMIGAGPLLRALGIGELANLYGQALVPLLLLLLATPRTSVRALGGVFALLLLGHSGVAISAAALLAVWLGWRLVSDFTTKAPGAQRSTAGDSVACASPSPPAPLPERERGTQRASILQTIVALGAGGFFALLVFYSAYTWIPAARQVAAADLAAQGVICPPGRPIGDKIAGIAGSALDPRGLVPPTLAAAGLAGALLTRRRGPALRVALLACWISVPLTFLTLFGSDQVVRWQHFLVPTVAAGAGLLLGAWQRRGRAGQLAGYALLTAALWHAAALWVAQIALYKH